MPAEPPEPRPTYSPYLLVHNVMRVLAADGCTPISITAENGRQPVKADADLLHALGVNPDRGEP